MPRNGGAGAGLPLETICTFACGRYPVLVESELFNGADPGALDWLLRTNLHFMQAVRHHRAGDVTKAMTALGEDNDAEELWAGILYRDGTGEYLLGWKQREGTRLFPCECIAFAEKLSFGLADDEAFWSWIARHSPLVRWKAWFKRETIEELADEVQNHEDIWQ